VKPPRRATVWWYDAHSSNWDWDEETLLRKHEPSLCGRQGWIVKVDKVGVSLAWEWSPTDGNIEVSPYRGRQFIPRGMVVRIDWWDDAPPPPT